MVPARPEGKWVAEIVKLLTACGVAEGTTLAIVCETQSSSLQAEMVRLASAQLGAKGFTMMLTSPSLRAPVPVRSTGASAAVQGLVPVIAALSGSEVIVDCTVEGLLHSPEIVDILKGGARLMMFSNEHPEVLERIGYDPEMEPRVARGIARAKAAKEMHIGSAAGTDLTVALSGAPIGGNWGYCTRPGTRAHWPGGLIAAYPNRGSVNGRLVFAPGDANLTFKRYFEDFVAVTLEDDFIVEIEGRNLDAELMRDHLRAWGDRNVYAVSHVGWGMNTRARWDALVMYDKSQFNGTEMRTFAGNFLFSSGANEHAGRFTEGHFDLPMRGCTISLDGETIVSEGVLQGDLA